MATYIIEIDERSKAAKDFIAFVKSYSKENDKIRIMKRPNKTTINAIKEALNGNGEKVEDIKSFLKEI
jgi:hypothetical protein